MMGFLFPGPGNMFYQIELTSSSIYSGDLRRGLFNITKFIRTLLTLKKFQGLLKNILVDKYYRSVIILFSFFKSPKFC